MRHDDWNQVHDLTVATVVEFWSALGEPVSFRGAVSQRDALWPNTVAVIGFGGAEIRGTLVLGVHARLLRRTHPLEATEHEDLVDWLVEISNQTLGRMKARLLRHDVSIEIGTPLAISASDLRLRSFRGPPLMMLFESSEGPVQVAFEAHSEPTVELAPRRSAAVTAPPGELIVF